MKRQQHLLIFVLFILTVLMTWLLFNDVLAVAVSRIQIDTIGHFVGFFALTWLLDRLLKLPLAELIMTLCCYAALTEIAQFYLGFRNGEVADFVADVLGICLYPLLKWAVIVYGKPKNS